MAAYMESKIKETVEKLQKRITEQEDELWALETLKRAKKKDGTPFSTLGKNYPEATIVSERSYSGYISSITIYVSAKGRRKCEWQRISATIWLGLDKALEVTFEQLEEAIAKRIEQLKADVESYRGQLKAVKPAFRKIQKIVDGCTKTIQSIPEANAGHYHTTLGYALVEYVRISI